MASSANEMQIFWTKSKHIWGGSDRSSQKHSLGESRANLQDFGHSPANLLESFKSAGKPNNSRRFAGICRNPALLSDTRKSKGFMLFTAELRESCKSADRYLPAVGVACQCVDERGDVHSFTYSTYVEWHQLALSPSVEDIITRLSVVNEVSSSDI